MLRIASVRKTCSARVKLIPASARTMAIIPSQTFHENTDTLDVTLRKLNSSRGLLHCVLSSYQLKVKHQMNSLKVLRMAPLARSDATGMTISH